jgi:D-glycero-alpha-D-manno-heptose-7-phosphate kinase
VSTRARTPLRVSFAGGGTDVPPFPAIEGGAVLSATINRHVYGALVPRTDGVIAVESPDLGISRTFAVGDHHELDDALHLVQGAIRRLGLPEKDGYELFLNSSAPPGSGLGSSSAVMVTLVGLLAERYGLAMDNYELARTAWSIEREDVGIRGGLQDHYAAAFGGFNFIEFHADQVVVNPLRMPGDVIDELEHNLLLCFTGRTRASDHVIEDQTRRVLDHDEEALAGLRAQKALAEEMKRTLLLGRCDAFGELLGEAWQQKKRMSPRITTDYIDHAYETALKHGALGGKVTGAGGGGFMLVYCDFRRRHAVAQALEDIDMRVEEVGFDPRGLVTWRQR